MEYFISKLLNNCQSKPPMGLCYYFLLFCSSANVTLKHEAAMVPTLLFFLLEDHTF